MAIEAVFRAGSKTAHTRNVFQHDKCQRLTFSGIELPARYEVHFSNSKDRGFSVACEGGQNGVLIPDALLTTGEYVYGYLHDTSGGTVSETLYTIIIPVTPKPVPVPIQVDSSGTVRSYEIRPEEENLVFKDDLNGIIQSVEDETDG